MSGARNRTNLPRFQVAKILRWADAFQRRHGRWPRLNDGPIPESDGDSWRIVDVALIYGLRGLSAGSSLAQLLAEQRGVRNVRQLPPLTEKQILEWADAHH